MEDIKFEYDSYGWVAIVPFAIGPDDSDTVVMLDAHIAIDPDHDTVYVDWPSLTIGKDRFGWDKSLDEYVGTRIDRKELGINIAKAWRKYVKDENAGIYAA